MSGGPSNNRVEPRFFGAPELYNKSPAKKEPVWPDESSNPPPPYTPSEPSSSSAASAPPLELTPEYSIYTPVHYGTIPQPYPANNTPDVVATPTWPWISPPRAPGYYLSWRYFNCFFLLTYNIRTLVSTITLRIRRIRITTNKKEDTL